MHLSNTEGCLNRGRGTLAGIPAQPQGHVTRAATQAFLLDLMLCRHHLNFLSCAQGNHTFTVRWAGPAHAVAGPAVIQTGRLPGIGQKRMPAQTYWEAGRSWVPSVTLQ